MTSIVKALVAITDSVLEPPRTKYEPNEHIFGHLRVLRREFKVRDFFWIVSKIAASFILIHKHNFRLHRHPKKGYNLGSIIGEGILKSNHFLKEE